MKNLRTMKKKIVIFSILEIILGGIKK